MEGTSPHGSYCLSQAIARRHLLKFAYVLIHSHWSAIRRTKGPKRSRFHTCTCWSSSKIPTKIPTRSWHHGQPIICSKSKNGYGTFFFKAYTLLADVNCICLFYSRQKTKNHIKCFAFNASFDRSGLPIGMGTVIGYEGVRLPLP